MFQKRESLLYIWRDERQRGYKEVAFVLDHEGWMYSMSKENRKHLPGMAGMAFAWSHRCESEKHSKVGDTVGQRA